MKGKRVNGMEGRKESLIPIYFSRVMLVTHTNAQFYVTTRYDREK